MSLASHGNQWLNHRRLAGVAGAAHGPDLVGPLDGAHRSIGVDANHERIAQRPSLLQIADVAGMELSRAYHEAEPGLVVSPADGTVVAVDELEHDEFVGGPAVQVGIFLSIPTLAAARTLLSALRWVT